MHAFGADYPPPASTRAPMVRTVTVRVFAFIYEVRPMQVVTQTATPQRQYCTVFALASSVANAEAIAINAVHQHRWHILRTDTAIALDAADVADLVDGRAVLNELSHYGVALRSQPQAIAA